jgi:hypothetical protein
MFRKRGADAAAGPWRTLTGLGLALAAGLLSLGLRPGPEPIPCVFSGVDKIVAVGDLHGDYQNFVKILRATGLVDENLHWIAGRTHLVQVGDVLDRGPSARRIFDLLIALETEAEAAGGKVHAILGNHEELALEGLSFDYPGYVTVEEFLSFLPDIYIDQKQNEYIRKKAAGQASPDDPVSISLTELMDFWKTVMADKGAQKEYFRFLRDRYGSWLLGHNVAVKINDIVFVHGGISESFSTMSLPEINDTFREEIGMVLRGARFNPMILFAANSPLWYRDLALKDEDVMKKDVDRILANLKAAHMVVGHSQQGYQTLGTMKRFGGKVWMIDTGISTSLGGRLSALIIENRHFEPWGGSHGAK